MKITDARALLIARSSRVRTQAGVVMIGIPLDIAEEIAALLPSETPEPIPEKVVVPEPEPERVVDTESGPVKAIKKKVVKKAKKKTKKRRKR